MLADLIGGPRLHLGGRGTSRHGYVEDVPMASRQNAACGYLGVSNLRCTSMSGPAPWKSKLRIKPQQLYDPPSPFIWRQWRFVVDHEVLVHVLLKYPAGLFWVRGLGDFAQCRSSFDSPPPEG
jgi:hypothetical protein